MSDASLRIGRAIDQTNIPLCLHGHVAADPPELATDEEWRQGMVTARKAKGMTQTQLAARVGTSQNIVSLIESGEVVSSSFILPICKVLSIAPPQFHATEEQRQWSQLGYLLRAQNPTRFRRALALVESMLEEPEQADAAASTPSPDSGGVAGRK